MCSRQQRLYKKEGKEIRDKCRGFQTLETKHHPVVKQGLAASQLISKKLYTEDWDHDKETIYYPVIFTPGYESAKKASELTKEVGLRQQWF